MLDLAKQIERLEIEIWDIGDIKPYPKNDKIHSKDQIKALRKIVTRDGWDVPIVVDADGVIIKGHGRRAVGIEEGLKRLPVIVRGDLTPEQVRKARIEDNRIVNFGVEYDMKLFNKEMGELTELGVEFDEFVDFDVDVNVEFDEPPAPKPKLKDRIEPKEPEKVFLVVVHCSGESDQEKVYQQMTECGYTCKVQSM